MDQIAFGGLKTNYLKQVGTVVSGKVTGESVKVVHLLTFNAPEELMW